MPAVPSPPQAPARQKLLAFLTPSIADLLFYETKEGRRTDAPAYGTAHPDTANWPNHKLVYVKQADEEGQFFRWYYAAARSAQDAYNFEHTVADIGGNKFSAVKRTYVNLRSAYTPLTPTMGTAMPNVPASLFSETFILAERQEQRIGDQELDSLFIVEQLTYVKRVTITEVTVRQKTGKGDFDVTTLYYKGENVSGVSPATTIQALVADQNNAYWGAQSDGSFRSVNQLSENWYAVTDRTFLDLESEYQKSASKLYP